MVLKFSRFICRSSSDLPSSDFAPVWLSPYDMPVSNCSMFLSLSSGTPLCCFSPFFQFIISVYQRVHVLLRRPERGSVILSRGPLSFTRDSRSATLAHALSPCGKGRTRERRWEGPRGRSQPPPPPPRTPSPHPRTRREQRLGLARTETPKLHTTRFLWEVPKGASDRMRCLRTSNSCKDICAPPPPSLPVRREAKLQRALPAVPGDALPRDRANCRVPVPSHRRGPVGSRGCARVSDVCLVGSRHWEGEGIEENQVTLTLGSC